MKKTDPYQTLLDCAFRYLSIRPRSKKELAEFLQKKASNDRISGEIIENVLSRLEEMDYINDKKFAETFVSASLFGKSKGPSAIRFYLQQKGISEEILSEVFKNTHELQDEQTQLFLARNALGKKGERYKTLSVLECKRKVYDSLMRKGFSPRIIHKLIDEYCKKA